MKVIKFSTRFPATHPRKGQHTYFVEKIWKSLWDSEKSSHNPLAGYWEKYDEAFPIEYSDQENIHNHAPKLHTIRAGNRWKVGDHFSPRVWSGKPYQSKQIQFAPPIQIKKIWDFEVFQCAETKIIYFKIDDVVITDFEADKLAKNDGLEYEDFLEWFNVKPDRPFIGQIIGWNEKVKYNSEINLDSPEKVVS